MTHFLALYSGDTVSRAELIALSADQRIVEDFAKRLVTDEPDDELRGKLDHRPSTNGSPQRRPTAKE